MKKLKENKIIKFICGLFKTIFVIICLLLLLIVISQKLSYVGKDVSIFGIKMFNVATGSMIPEYNVGDIIFDKETPIDELKVGDDITYAVDYQDSEVTITHRIVKIRIDENDGKTYITTKGLANNVEDSEISSDAVRGKVVYRSVILSFINKLLTNAIAYFVIFTVVGISASIQIITSFKGDDDDEESDE